MSLPDLLQPAGTPCFLLADHGITPDPLHDRVGRLQGHSRLRKIYTEAPRYVVVSVDLSDAQAEAYDAWFEGALSVGNGLFTAEIARLGSGSHYWTAQWVGPPLWTPRAAADGVRWRLSGQLLLTGTGTDARPLGGTLATEYVIELRGAASLASGVSLATEYVVELLGVDPLFTEYVIELLAIVPGYYEREDSGFIQREDGSYLQRE